MSQEKGRGAKEWRTKQRRPEEKHRFPTRYYSKRRVSEYASSPHMKKKQRELTERVLDLLEAEAPAKTLDLGCGTGYSMEFLEQQGYEVYGIDIVTEMVRRAKRKGLNAIVGDIRFLKDYYQKGEFDYVVSISALQWISKNKEDIKEVREGVDYVLKEEGGLGIQFYPKSSSEMKKVGKVLGEHDNGNGDSILGNAISVLRTAEISTRLLVRDDRLLHLLRLSVAEI